MASEDTVPRTRKVRFETRMNFRDTHDVIVPVGAEVKWIEGGQGGWAVAPGDVRLMSRTESLFKHDSEFYHLWVPEESLAPETKVAVDRAVSERVALYVVVEGEPSEPEDEEVAGFHRVEVDSDLSSADRCNAALDVFHSKVAVGALDDFTFSVFTEEGVELDQDGTGDYRFSDRGRYVGPVGDLPFPDPTKVRTPAAGR